jgi:D-alanyl-D-alanine carboxypeptidase (penicillin-binding protein 5/6)
MNREDRIFTISILSLAALISLLALPQTTTHISADNTPVAPKNYFNSIELQARAAYVFDSQTGKPLFAKNESSSLPLASLTKIMTAVTAAELAPASTIVTIDPESLSQDGDSGLLVNERWQLSKLLQYTLVASSNDGAAAIAHSLGSTQSFVDYMNFKAKKLNLTTMHFNNPSGLDQSQTEAGAYGSAEDVAHLLAYAISRDRDIIEPTRYPTFEVSSMDNVRHVALNTDSIAGKIPSLIAGKTGYTDLAGGNLAIVFDAGLQHPVVVVVLGSTYDGRFQDVQKLVDASIQTITTGI